MTLDALYTLIIGSNHLSTVNAVLLGIVFLLARQRYKTIVREFTCLQKSTREHEQTFVKYNMEIQREK